MLQRASDEALLADWSDKLRRIRQGRGWLAPVLALACAGCTLGPDFAPPAAPAQSVYTPGGSAEKGAGDQHFALGQKIAGDWWTLYRSDPLNDVLKQAVAGNRTLVAAQATLAAAQESVIVAGAAREPQIDVGGGASRYHQNGAPLGLPKLPPGFPGYASLFHVGPTVSFALDVWGGTQRAVEESAALADVSDDQLDAAYLTLTGNAVLQALTIASLRSQLATVDGIIADDATNLRLVDTEVKCGRGDAARHRDRDQPARGRPHAGAARCARSWARRATRWRCWSARRRSTGPRPISISIRWRCRTSCP